MDIIKLILSSGMLLCCIMIVCYTTKILILEKAFMKQCAKSNKPIDFELEGYTVQWISKEEWEEMQKDTNTEWFDVDAKDLDPRGIPFLIDNKALNL